MKNDEISLTFFEFVLKNTDWMAENRSVDPAARINGLTSIAFAADCYLSLSRSNQIIAKSLLIEHTPYKWRGWRIVMDAAHKRRRIFSQAIAIGMLSDIRQADNYYGHYFYTHSEGGRDYFRDRRTFAFVSSPFSKAEIDKDASEIIARCVLKE